MGVRIVVGTVAAVVLLQTVSTPAQWQRIFEEDFAADPGWTYNGVVINQVGPMFQYDAGGQRISAEWDQSLNFSSLGDPYVIESSSLTAPLGTTLTDDDTFRFGATVQIGMESVPDTTEIYQIANFGLYNPALSGPDRTGADDFSGNATLVPDISNAIEFNYFINNRAFTSFDPNIQPSVITDHDGNSIFSHITIGSSSDAGFWHDTDMGPDNYLPENTDLFVEVTYYGDSAGADARRAYAAIYTDAARTSLLSVNGVPMYYWTQAVPTGQSFAVTHFGFQNYVDQNWGGPNGRGSGSYDDTFVDVVPEPQTVVWLALGGLVWIRKRFVRGAR